MLGREHAVGHPALTDEFTGLANRLHFELVFSYLFNGADRGVPMVLMLISVGGDSDRDGLRELGELFQRITRSADLASHLGHGRFAVLMLGTNMMGARVAADRFLDALEGHTPGTVSIGLASYSSQMKESSVLLEAADKALRTAEESGSRLEMAPT
jgi:diguanylate cyclase (GGDEF)-like protein